MIHELITQWAGKAPIKQLCRVLEVSRSGFYAARQRAARAPVTCSDSVHVKAVFEASGSSYGSGLTANDAVVQIDLDGNGVVDMEIKLLGTTRMESAGTYGYVTLETAQQIFGFGEKVSGVLIELKQPGEVKEVIKRLRAAGEIEAGELVYLDRIADRWIAIAASNARRVPSTCHACA